MPSKLNMVSNYPEIHQQASSRIPQPSNYSYFTEQAIRAGLMEPELGRTQQHYHSYSQPRSSPLPLYNSYPEPHPEPHPEPLPPSHPHLHNRPYPSPQSHEMHEAIQREIEKQQIREEIIMSEIVRRRVLESEVRRELMLERDLNLQRWGNGVPIGPPSVVGFESPTRIQMSGTGGEVRSLKERILLPPTGQRLNRRLENWNGGFDIVPFRRSSTDLRISEINPDSEGENEKGKLILLSSSRPDEDKPGSKRKAETPPAGPGSTEPLSDDGISRKKIKEWTCAVCQVSAPCEKTLNQHLRGKKHKCKEASLSVQRGGKNYSIGLYPKNASKPIEGLGVGDWGPSGCPTPVLMENLTSGNSKKNRTVVVPEPQKQNDLKKNTYRFRCELCHVEAHTLKILNAHKRGKKHLKRVEARNASERNETVMLANGQRFE